MNDISIYSDPHQGLNLAANTTSDSRKRLREFIRINTASIVERCKESSMLFCAGDFFHSYQNPEEVIIDSIYAAANTTKILSGNHDVVNIQGRFGSLDVIKQFLDTHVVETKFGDRHYVCAVDQVPEPQYLVCMVPHHSTQDLFDSALELAAQYSKATCEESRTKILITHCNYDSNFATDDASLNLSSRKAAFLLEYFDYIVLGHEHMHRTDHDDRVIIVGSPHPTNFGDISDKFILHFKDGEPSLETVWVKDDHYLEIDWTEANDQSRYPSKLVWVKLTGQIQASELHTLASLIKNIWKEHKPFAVKSEVQVLVGDHNPFEVSDGSSQNISTLIEQELKDSPDLLNLWKEVSGDNQSDAD